MAFSHRTTTLAVFRGILGAKHGQEAHFAGLAGRSVSWVKKVSAGIEPLAEEPALALETSTGISAAWLLKGDPGAPPVGAAGKPYDFAAFERHRANPNGAPAAKTPASLPAHLLSAIAGIGAAAGRRGRASLFSYRLAQFLDDCRTEFGFDKAATVAIKESRKTKSRPAAPARHSASRKPVSDDTTESDLAVHLL